MAKSQSPPPSTALAGIKNHTRHMRGRTNHNKGTPLLPRGYRKRDPAVRGNTLANTGIKNRTQLLFNA